MGPGPVDPHSLLFPTKEQAGKRNHGLLLRKRSCRGTALVTRPGTSEEGETFLLWCLTGTAPLHGSWKDLAQQGTFLRALGRNPESLVRFLIQHSTDIWFEMAKASMCPCKLQAPASGLGPDPVWGTCNYKGNWLLLGSRYSVPGGCLLCGYP